MNTNFKEVGTFMKTFGKDSRPRWPAVRLSQNRNMPIENRRHYGSKYLETLGKLWKPSETFGDRREPSRTVGNPQKPSETVGNLSKPSEKVQTVCKKNTWVECLISGDHV